MILNGPIFILPTRSFFRLYPGFIVNLHPHELFFCSTIIDSNNWSILTTQQLVTNESGNTHSGNIEKATIVTYGDFKAGNRQLFTLGELLQDKTSIRYFIETGCASMVMINAVKRRVRLALQ